MDFHDDICKANVGNNSVSAFDIMTISNLNKLVTCCHEQLPHLVDGHVRVAVYKVLQVLLVRVQFECSV